MVDYYVSKSQDIYPSRQVFNAAPATRADFSATAATILGSGSAVVATDKKSITFASGGAGRAFVGYTETLGIGFWVLSIRVSNCNGTFTNQNLSVTAGTAVIAAGTLNAVNGLHNGRLYVAFQVTTGGTVTTRFGLGLPSNETSGVSLTMSDYMIEPVAAINTVPSEFVPCGVRAAFNYALGNTVSSGKYINEAQGAAISQCASKNVLFHGDSFQNEITEFPFIVQTNTTYGCIINGFNGRTLQTGISQVVDNYNLVGCEFIPNSTTGNSIAAPYYTGTANPSIWVTELCINDIIISPGASIADMESRLRSYVAALRSVFGGPHIVFNASPCANNVNWTAGKQTVIDAYNALLPSLATELNFTVFDRYTLLGEPGSPTQLATIYEKAVPDGLHPNTAGETALANSLTTLIDAAYVTVSSTAGYSLGSDSNDGLTKATPWLTETHAVSSTVVNDGVWLNTGAYGAFEIDRSTRFTRGPSGLVASGSAIGQPVHFPGKGVGIPLLAS